MLDIDIADLIAADLDFLKLDGSRTMTGNLLMGAYAAENKIIFGGTTVNDVLIRQASAGGSQLCLRRGDESAYGNLIAAKITFHNNLMAALATSSLNAFGSQGRLNLRVYDNVSWKTVIGIGQVGAWGGHLYFPNLPAVDPADGTGKIWNNANVVTVGT